MAIVAAPASHPPRTQVRVQQEREGASLSTSCARIYFAPAWVMSPVSQSPGQGRSTSGVTSLLPVLCYCGWLEAVEQHHPNRGAEDRGRAGSAEEIWGGGT